MTDVEPSRVSSRDVPRQAHPGRWPRRRIIWSCQADRGPLLTRYSLVESRRLGIYLHRLHVSDEDRALHDHPWSFLSWLIGGGYYEHTAEGRFWRRRFSLLWRPAEWRHRLELRRPTWTLVIRGSRRRRWGFVIAGRWVGWQAYGTQWCD